MTDHAAITAEDFATKTGLEQLRGLIRGGEGSISMGRTLNFHLVSVGEGSAVFQGTPTGAFVNPAGVVHGGWASTVLDSALGCAIHTTLVAGERYTTLELKVNLTRGIMPGMGPFTATGTVLTRGRRVATSEARLTDAVGKLYAHATTTCLIMAPER